MNRRVMKNMVTILQESPLYLELSSRERYSLAANLMDFYAALPDLAAEPKRGDWLGQDLATRSRPGQTR